MVNLQKDDGNRSLNITNGDYFNNYFLSKFGGEAIPLCEVMMDGETISGIYSDDFVRLRASKIGVSIEEYRSKMRVFDALRFEPNRYTELCLWFGNDTFCQMNLLMLLAYLEQIGFQNKVTLNLIDDETFEVLAKDIEVSLGSYKQLYEKILVSKSGNIASGVISQRAVDLYFDYHSGEGRLARLVKDNSDKDDITIISLLLENSNEYALSDIQAQRLIEKYKV